MQLKFDANQEYQLAAIAAVVDLFEGQGRQEASPVFSLGSSAFSAIPNRLDLREEDLLSNLSAVQVRNAIRPDGRLETLGGDIQTAEGAKNACFFNFSVEMETGTGKTYVYIRTAMELYQRYAWRKFIIVVPSVAIREGVLKTFQITEAHLKELYGNLPYRYTVYDSASLSQVRQFALSDGIEFLIMTLASFNKAANVIHQSTDRLQGETPIHLVQASRPILILDEPQNMESEKSIAALSVLDPLFAMRYSATHRTPYNIVYRLTPFEAYRQGLVKKIEVAGVEREGDEARPYLRLIDIKSEKRTLTAAMIIHKLMRNGTVQQQTITVKPGDDLEEKSGRTEYRGYRVDEINLGEDLVRFENEVEIRIGQELGADREDIFEAQIRYTIEEHFRKQRRLMPQGIKALSLFFIDRVDNYARQDGIIRVLFNRIFNEVRQHYPEWQNVKPEDVHNGYFSQRRTRSGEVIFEDSKTGEAESDREAYDLILKDKERLLSLEEPLAFIFSHSALREGWDNPNVFQICTLHQSVSEVRKRQEIGRGVRLAVDQTGNRVREERMNVLTVIANESYERYVTALQSEIALEFRAEIEARYGKAIEKLTDEERAKVAEEYGKGMLPPKPANARKRVSVHYQNQMELSDDFKGLWQKISQKTRYAVKIDSQKLVVDVTHALAEVEIRPPRVTVTKARVDVNAEGAFEALQQSAAKTLVDLSGRYALPNLVEIMANLMEHTTPPVRLTRKTLLEIIRCAPNQAAVVDNPQEFAAVAVRLIKEKLADQLIDGILYVPINAYYEMSQFKTDYESWAEYLAPSRKSPYDQVTFESEIERQFVEDMERMEQVKFYIKLPDWFTVPTPIGEYNPDWAIVWEPRDEHGEPTGEPKLYLVRETKGSTRPDDLRPDERRKTHCGKQHFAEAIKVDYQVISNARELP